MSGPPHQADPVTLVVGSTGLLGHAVCKALRRHGLAVRALVRSTGSLARPLPPGCEAVVGDLKVASTLAAACRGVTTVVTTANAMLSRKSGDTLERVDRDGTRTLVAAAREAGVAHVVYVSVSPALPADNAFVRYKREAERTVRGSGMRWTILQPTAFMEVHTGRLGGWDFARGRAQFVGSGRNPVSLISVEDVAAVAALAVLEARGPNRDLHLGGPDALSAIDALAIARRVTGRAFRVRKVPAGALRVMAILARPISSPMASLFQMLAAGAAGDAVDMAPVLRDFPIRLTTFEAYVRRSIV